MRKLLTILSIFAPSAAVGCTGEQLAPGGYLKAQSDGKGAVMFYGGGNIAVKEATYKGPTGETFSIKGYTRDSSTLGTVQGQASVAMEELYARNFDTLMREVLGPIIARYAGGGGSVVIPGGTTTPPADLSALKATLTARIAACPFLGTNPALRDSLTAQVAAVNSAEGAAILQKIVDSLYTQAAIKVTP